MICHVCKREDPGAQPWGAGRQPICFDCAQSDPEREAIAKMYMRERITEVSKELAARFGVEITDDNRAKLESIAAVQIAMPELEITGAMGVSRGGAVVSQLGSMAPPLNIRGRSVPQRPFPARVNLCDCSICRGERVSMN